MGAIANHRMVSAGEAASATSASYDQEGKNRARAKAWEEGRRRAVEMEVGVKSRGGK